MNLRSDTARQEEKQRDSYRIIHGSARQLRDVTAFIETLDYLVPGRAWPSSGGEPRPEVFPPEALKLFDPDVDLVIARAPGRLDVMGGIADYSGSLVLELPIAEATFVALQKDSSRMLRVVSLANDTERDTKRDVMFEMSLAELEQSGTPIEYDMARRYFKENGARHWAAYVAGVFLVLMRECGIPFREGARLLISSRVPEGKGVSSSAALEVATMSAVAAAFSLELEPRKLALLCQRVENFVVGAPCGVMDQITSACGEADQLLALLCQPAEVLETIALPADLGVWGLDSGVRHSVSGADYGSVRVGTFMGYRMIAEFAGLPIKRSHEYVSIEDTRWRGYLANLAVSEFEELYAARLPESIAGSNFLSRYSGTTDTITRVEANKTYAVRMPTVHAVYESFRVRTFAELLRCQTNGTSEHQRVTLGELMYQSHASYSACGLGSSGTDKLVRLVKAAGKDQGLYGAKITGGGSGGTVAVLGRRDAETAITALAEQYAEQTGYTPHIFRGSSPGSASFGHLRVRRTG
jgi:galactokinase